MYLKKIYKYKYGYCWQSGDKIYVDGYLSDYRIFFVLGNIK